MGRHSKEADSPVPATSATLGGRHRGRTRRFALTSYFRRSRHRPHSDPDPNVFRHEGADIAWSGTLAGIVATTRPGMKPVSRPVPEPAPAPRFVPMPGLAREFVEALMPATPPAELDLAATAHLDPPTHYRRLVALTQHRTRFINVRSSGLARMDTPGV